MRAKRHLAWQLAVWSSIAWVVELVRADPAPHPIPPVDEVYPIGGHGVDPPGSELTDAGRNVRGIYLPVPKVVRTPIPKLVSWVADSVGATAVVIDIKDDTGRVTFTRELEGATGRVHGLCKHMPELVAALQARNIYVIGRLVSFKDNMFYKGFPDAAVRDRRTGNVWRDKIGMAWNDPGSKEAHDHIVRIAQAAQAVGFNEIQLDYVRYPIDGLTRHAKFPHNNKDAPRHVAIASLMAEVDKALHIPLSADVFGLTAFNIGDPNGLGQSLEHLAPHLDAISPMLYLANFNRRDWEDPDPSRIQTLINNAVLEIRDRIDKRVAIRPLLQAFPYRAPNFGRDFIARQIDSATAAGSSGYLFWNQLGHYRLVAQVWENLDRKATSAAVAP